MYLEALLEVIIGMVFIWLVMSTVTMQLQEWNASLFHLRARDLKNAIQGMLGSRNLTQLFYDHPIIRGISPKSYGRTIHPSYIPANQFSTVLLNTLLNASSESAMLIYGMYDLTDKVKLVKDAKRRQSAQEELNHLFELAQLTDSTRDGGALDNLILATLEKRINEYGDRYAELKPAVHAVIENAHSNREKLEKTILSMPELSERPTEMNTLLTGALAMGIINPALKSTLNALMLGSETWKVEGIDALQPIRNNIETWFTDSMDRVTGWYKRKTQFTTFLIGILVALMLNIDSIHMAQTLWQEPALRETISANADLLIAQYPAESGNQPDALTAIEYLQEQYPGIPLGWNFSPIEVSSPGQCSFAPGEGQVFGLRTKSGCLRPFDASELTNGWTWSVIKFFGLMLTGLACSQGSSFWFDLLSRIVNVRSTGSKPSV
jgi:hypothetical protein